jgi:hypothetical protein
MLDQTLLRDHDRIRRLAHDHAPAGGFDVDERWTKLLDAIAAVQVELAPVEDTPRDRLAATEHDAVEKITAAALAGKPMPAKVLAAYVEARRAMVDHEDAAGRAVILDRVLSGSPDGLLVQLRRAVIAGADAFTIGSTRPALERELAELKEAAKVLHGISDRGDRALDKVPNGRELWDRVDEQLRPAVDAIMSAHLAVFEIAVLPLLDDPRDALLHVRHPNIEQLQPHWREGIGPETPDEAGPYAAWITGVGRPWLPLAAELGQQHAERRTATNREWADATDRAAGRVIRSDDDDASGQRCVACGDLITWTGTGYVGDTTGVMCEALGSGLHIGEAGAQLPAAIGVDDEGDDPRPAA